MKGNDTNQTKERDREGNQPTHHHRRPRSPYLVLRFFGEREEEEEEEEGKNSTFPAAGWKRREEKALSINPRIVHRVFLRSPHAGFTCLAHRLSNHGPWWDFPALRCPVRSSVAVAWVVRCGGLFAERGWEAFARKNDEWMNCAVYVT